MTSDHASTQYGVAAVSGLCVIVWRLHHVGQIHRCCCCLSARRRSRQL